MSYINHLAGAPVPGATAGVTTDQRMPLATRYSGDLGKEWMYVVAGAAIAAGAIVQVTGAGTATEATATTAASLAGFVAVAPVAIASGSYGWVQTKGACSVLCAASVLFNSPIAFGTVAGLAAPSSGVLVTASPQIYGLRFTATGSTSGTRQAALLTNPVVVSLV